MIKITIIKITKMIKITIIKMTKMINNLISGRETQLRSPFYSPLNSMWQVGGFTMMMMGIMIKG